MPNNKTSILVFAVVGLLIFSFFIFIRGTQPKHDWSETYGENSKEPYGTYVVYNLIQQYFENANFHQIKHDITDELPTDISDANFVFIGQALFLDSTDVEAIVQFVENGNTAFFSTKTIPNRLMEHFYDGACPANNWIDYSSKSDSTVRVSLINPNLNEEDSLVFSQLYENETTHWYNWHYMDKGFFCEEYDTSKSLGYLDDTEVNFVYIPFGDGKLFLHTTPIAFTNIQLLEKKNVDYASKLFSYLNHGDIYWCTAARTSERIGRRANSMGSGGRQKKANRESPLKYILSQPGLAWAWYLSMVLGLMYIVFRAKRKQRVIPVLAENKNTSLEFIATMGKLYFIQNNHRNLSLEKMSLLLSDIRAKYKIPAKDLGENFIKTLHLKSEVPEALLHKILLYHRNIENSQHITETTMVEFHQLIDTFYKNSK